MVPSAKRRPDIEGIPYGLPRAHTFSVQSPRPPAGAALAEAIDAADRPPPNLTPVAPRLACVSVSPRSQSVSPRQADHPRQADRSQQAARSQQAVQSPRQAA